VADNAAPIEELKKPRGGWAGAGIMGDAYSIYNVYGSLGNQLYKKFVTY
jgi:hypothetical protein